MLDRLKQEAIEGISRLRRSPWQSEGLVRVLVETPYGFDSQLWIDALEQELPGWRRWAEVHFASDRMALLVAARSAQVVSVMDLGAGLVRAAGQAEWINVLLSGVNQDAVSRVRTGVRITSSRGIAAGSMAEHALLYFLSLRNDLRLSLRNQDEWRWSEAGLLGSVDDLAAATVAVLGLGEAGQAVARLFRSIGCRVIGVRRCVGEPHPLCHELCALEDFRQILPRADLIVLTLPMVATTRQLFASAEFQAMKRSAILVNLSRGGLLHEDDLAAALRAGIIGGAGLDVLATEPPAADHPLRNCPNLILTPHVSGNIQKFRSPITARFARNLSAFRAGETLEGLLS